MSPHQAEREGPWLSTAHGASHRPGGGDEIIPTDIGAVTHEELEQLADRINPTAFTALENRIAVLEAAFNAHRTQKAGQAHK